MKKLAIILSILFTLNIYAEGFIADRQELRALADRPDALIVASTGRSGSTLLHKTLLSSARKYDIFKTHLLPPETPFAGKILFIFSNPDLSAESALHMTISDESFGKQHFLHMESSDKKWLKKIGSTTHQTEKHNLLSYDALGCALQLEAWLHAKTALSDNSPYQSTILAIKYENLWDPETIAAIEQFLDIEDLCLPEKRERGCSFDQLKPKEILFRSLYNQGSWKQPLYQAYDQARDLWESAPPFLFLNIPSKPQ